MSEEIVKAHADDYNSTRFGAPKFVEYPPRDDGSVRDGLPHCSYCGSITVADALRLFLTSGVQWSASDWKYGWPHKFYLTVPCEPVTSRIGTDANGAPMTATITNHHLKFYTTHLRDATPDQLAEWNAHVDPIVGVKFELSEDGRLKFGAVRGAQSMFGTIA